MPLNDSTPQHDRPLHCAVILTALQLEAQAIIEFIGEQSTEYDAVGTAYTCGTLSAGDKYWKVAIAECGAGNQRAGHIATHAIHHFDPVVVFFIGVAGSLKSDIELGDVVASTKVYNYHSGKAEKDFQPRPAIENTSFRLEQLARGVARTRSWLQRIQRQHPDRPGDPIARVGPIAAGEQVDADERSHTHKLIKQFYSDALAVEMEGYGTLAATNVLKMDAIIIRGISDNVVDKAQCDGKSWQPLAAHYASAFAVELLAHYQATRAPRCKVEFIGLQKDVGTEITKLLADMHGHAIGNGVFRIALDYIYHSEHSRIANHSVKNTISSATLRNLRQKEPLSPGSGSLPIPRRSANADSKNLFI